MRGQLLHSTEAVVHVQLCRACECRSYPRHAVGVSGVGARGLRVEKRIKAKRPSAVRLTGVVVECEAVYSVNSMMVPCAVHSTMTKNGATPRTFMLV